MCQFAGRMQRGFVGIFHLGWSNHGMFSSLQAVVIKHAHPKEGIGARTLGTVVEVFGEGAAYLVECCNRRGETIALLTLAEEQLEAAAPLERPPRPLL